MSTFVLVHGSFAGDWCWKRVLPYLHATGHTVYTPTLTGMGERSHLRAPTINLSCHIQDIVNVILYEDLEDVILVGHSSTGVVITGVADKVPSRLSQLVYLDAFVPESGQSIIDQHTSTSTPDSASKEPVLPDSWFISHIESVEEWGITDPEDIEWVTARLTPITVAGVVEKLYLNSKTAAHIRKTYISCTVDQFPVVERTASRIRESPGWQYLELETRHAAMITEPKALAELLNQIL